MEQKFKVGDKVKGMGTTGIIKNIIEDSVLPIEVRWDNNTIAYFYADGRYFQTGEPCLELLERPKKKGKRTYYRAFYFFNVPKDRILMSCFYISKEELKIAHSMYEIISIEEKEFEIEEY